MTHIPSSKCSRRFLFLFIIPILIVSGCSPIPLIQSPRINSKFAIGASVKTSGDVNINTAEPAIRSKEMFIADEKLPLLISVGIRDRVELSGVVAPYLWYGVLWQGNIKVALFELNKDKKFRNIAAAMFAGSSGYKGEHEDKLNYYGGLSFGSIARTGPGSLELVLQSSVSYEEEIGFESQGRYSIYWLQPATGIIYKPVRSGLVEFNLGVNYSYPLKSDVLFITSYSPELTSAKIHDKASGGFVFIGALRFNIVR